MNKEIEKAMESLTEAFADVYIVGRPAILGAGFYTNLEKFVKEQAEKIEETFPLK